MKSFLQILNDSEATNEIRQAGNDAFEKEPDDFEKEQQKPVRNVNPRRSSTRIGKKIKSLEARGDGVSRSINTREDWRLTGVL